MRKNWSKSFKGECDFYLIQIHVCNLENVLNEFQNVL